MTAKDRLVEQNCTLAELKRVAARRRREQCVVRRSQAACRGLGPRVRRPHAAGIRSEQATE
jgi:hypothetical protein